MIFVTLAVMALLAGCARCDSKAAEDKQRVADVLLLTSSYFPSGWAG